jgi:hypothetical protein
MRELIKEVLNLLVVSNFLWRRSKSYLLGTRAYLLASHVKSDTLNIALPNGHDYARK